MKKHVLIIGAGLAGLTAAVELVSEGFRVTILEKRPFPGGRTFSFYKNFWPFPVDNGPHVLLGCYSEMLNLLRKIGSTGKLQPQLRLSIPYLQPHENPIFLNTVSLPAPFHFLTALMKFPLLNFAEKSAIVMAAKKIQNLQEDLSFDSLSAEKWLTQNGQNERTMTVFWAPLIQATLNSEPAGVSFLQLLRVLRIGFLQGKQESRMILMPEGLSVTLIEPIVHWLEERGCTIEFRKPVRKMVFHNGKIVQLAAGSEIYDHFDGAISAIPFKPLVKILQNSELPDDEILSTIRSFHSNAILNLHFWYQGRLIPEPFAAFVNRSSQWLFVQKTNGGITHHTTVVSGAGKFLLKDKEDIYKNLVADLHHIFSGFDESKLLRHYVMFEKNATLACPPGVEPQRPQPGPLFTNLSLAGDWTSTGLPPTMESAVRSGKLAAEKIKNV